MIAKVIAYGEDREQARRRLHRALEETAVKGITTNNRFLIELLDSEEFISGNYHTGSIAELMARDEPESSEREKDIATIAAVIQTFAQDRQSARLVATGSEDNWRWNGARLARDFLATGDVLRCTMSRLFKVKNAR